MNAGFKFLAALFGVSAPSLPITAGFLPRRGKHRRDPKEKIKSQARARAAAKVARQSRKVNRRLERLRA